MKLQFNLLPDVKQQYLKTQRTKRTVIAAAFLASAISVFILLIMVTTVYVINKKQLSDADKDVTKYSNQLKSIPDLDKILTIQNQLKSVAGLHQSKHITSRLYTYLPQVTPSDVCLGKVTMDLTASTLIIDGTTDSLKTANTYIDTLKFTTYKVDGQSAQDAAKQKAFPSVVESQFSLASTANNSSNTTCNGKKANASYQLTIAFDPALFSNNQSVELVVPQGRTTTRSVLDDPNNELFNGQTKETLEQQSNTQAGGQ